MLQRCGKSTCLIERYDVSIRAKKFATVWPTLARLTCHVGEEKAGEEHTNVSSNTAEVVRQLLQLPQRTELVWVFSLSFPRVLE